MKVDSINTDRFELALDLLQQGNGIQFSNVYFWVNSSSNIIEVRTITGWQIGNLTDEIALSEVQRGMDAFEYLSTNSQRFDEITTGKEVRFSVVRDMGNSTVEVCHFSAQRIVWS